MSLNILGYPSGWRYPFIKAELRMNAGVSSAPAGIRTMLVVGPATSAGSWAPNKVYENVADEQSVIAGAGAGSQLHRAARMIWSIDKKAKVSFIVTSDGGAGTAADSLFTFSFSSGSNPSATGKVSMDLCGELVEFGFSTSMTLSDIVNGVIATVNAKTYLPFSAASTVNPGEVKVTAKTVGAIGGDGTTGVFKCSMTVDPGKNVALTATGAYLGLGAGTIGVDGGTSAADACEDALDLVLTRDEYYVIACHWLAAPLAKFKAYIEARNEPSVGRFGCVVAGNTMALASCSTVAIGLNTHYMSICHQRQSEHDPVELASALGALLRKHEEVDVTANLNQYSGSDWPIKPQSDSTVWPTEDELNDAVTDGISPVQSLNSARTCLGMNITTHSKSPSGSLNDWRSAERHRVSGMHALLSTIMTNWALSYGSKKLAPDVTDASGQVVSGQGIRPNVVTPSLTRSLVARDITSFYSAGHLSELDPTLETLEVRIDPTNKSRVQVGFSTKVIDHLNQTSFLAFETNEG